MAAVVLLASQPVLLEQVATQLAPLPQVSELQAQPREQRQERAQELRASLRAQLERERGVLPGQARDALPAAAARAPPSEAFAVLLWPPLPWLRDPLRRLPRRPRRLSNDDELFQQLRR